MVRSLTFSYIAWPFLHVGHTEHLLLLARNNGMKMHTKTLLFFLSFLVFSCSDRPGTDSLSTNSDTTSTETPIPEKPQPTPPVDEDPVDLSTGEKDVNTTDENITHIRQQYQEIRTLLNTEKLRAVELEGFCDRADSNGTFTRYYAGESVMMMKKEYGLGDFAITETIYLEDEKPFFIFNRDIAYTYNTASEPVVDITETRYYLKNGKIIRKLEKSYSYLNKGEDNRPDADQIPNQSMTDVVDTNYPELTAVTKMVNGEVKCD